MAVFLLDVFCMGVKNAYIFIMSEQDYQSRLENMLINEPLKKVSASYARKVIEEAEKYAGQLGFLPHKDYHSAKIIFGDIETESCSESFEFGKNGKPFYVSGPYDSANFIKKVIKQLTGKCGIGQFDYVSQMDDHCLE